MSVKDHPRTRDLIQRLQDRPMRKDLDPVRSYVSRRLSLGSSTRVVQVVGSNGKGSFVHYARQMLNQLDRDTVSYTSPHLDHPRERITFNTNPVSASQLESLLGKIPRSHFTSMTPFELLLLGCLHLAETHRPDVLLLEAGMGGRWDATSAVPADFTVLTSLDREHTEHLGSTLQEIFREKTAQIPAGTVFLHPELPSECAGDRVELLEQKDLRTVQWGSSDSGESLCQAARTLVNEMFEESRSERLPTVDSLERLPCRQERLRTDERTVLLDGAHSPSALKALLNRMERENFPGWGLLFGVLENKTTEPMAQLLKHANFPLNLVVTRPNSPRGRDPQSLKREWDGKGLDVTVRPDPLEGWQFLHRETDPEWGLCAAGSFTLAAEIRRQCKP